MNNQVHSFDFRNAECGVGDQVSGRRHDLLFPPHFPTSIRFLVAIFQNDMSVLKDAFGEAETATLRFGDVF